MTCQLHVAALLLAVTACANANVTVDLLSSAFSTDLSLSWSEFPSGGGNSIPRSLSGTTTSATPITNSIQSPNNPLRFATASAGQLNVSAATSAFPNTTFTENSGFAKTVAQSTLTFRPLGDVTVPLSLAFDGSGGARFSQGFVSLFDATLNQSVSHYSWDRFTMAGNVPFDQNFDAFVDFATNLISSHVYTLTMNVGTDANTDSQSMAIRLAGLQPIASAAPEPETWAMMMVGLAFVGYATRRHTRSTQALRSRGIDVRN